MVIAPCVFQDVFYLHASIHAFWSSFYSILFSPSLEVQCLTFFILIISSIPTGSDLVGPSRKASFVYSPCLFLLKYNWLYNVLIWYLYTLWNDHNSGYHLWPYKVTKIIFLVMYSSCLNWGNPETGLEMRIHVISMCSQEKQIGEWGRGTGKERKTSKDAILPWRVPLAPSHGVLLEAS